MTTVSRILRVSCFAFLPVLVAREQLAPENDNCLEDSACALIVGGCETLNPKRSGWVRNPEWVGAKKP